METQIFLDKIWTVEKRERAANNKRIFDEISQKFPLCVQHSDVPPMLQVISLSKCPICGIYVRVDDWRPHTYVCHLRKVRSQQQKNQ